MDISRPRSRPSKRWRDEIDDFWRSVLWKQSAQDRLSWKIIPRPSCNTFTEHDDDDDETVICMYNVLPDQHSLIVGLLSFLVPY